MASERILAKKRETVSEIVNKINESSTVVLIDYKNLTVAGASELRRKLRESGSEFKVYKNTLTNLALKETNIALNDYMAGSNALVFSKDTIAPIKTISEFIKKNKVLEMRVGLIDGNIADQATLEKYATIPDRKTLLTMVATGVMGTMKNFAICLDLYSKQKEN